MVGTEISFPAPDGSFQIYGDLTLPPQTSSSSPTLEESAKVPAILIVNGSGPIDRNGDAHIMPLITMTLNTSNRFAEHMASRQPEKSIAVLSYDKRGVGKSQKKGDKNLFYRSGMMDIVSDAVEAVRYLSNHPRIDRKKIIVLGHSEGAIIMPLICEAVIKNGLDPIFGCIFYCGFGENLKDAMRLQRERTLQETQEMEGVSGWLLRKLITKEKLEKQYNDLMGKVDAEGKPDYISMQLGLVKQPAKWLREHLEYDPHPSLAENITCHCLAITGKKDVQVRNEFCTEEKAAELLPKAASIEVHRPENLTHALRSLDGPSKIMNIKKDYGKMSKMPLDDELLSITDVWCDRILSKSG